MHEIKTVDERLSGIDFSGNRVEVSTEEFSALNDEVSELRAAYEALQKENEAQSKRIAELEDAVNREAILKTLVLFQTECEILADTFRNGNMASKAIGKIDLVKFMDKWDKLISEVK